jgi:hypothetical protein
VLLPNRNALRRNRKSCETFYYCDIPKGTIFRDTLGDDSDDDDDGDNNDDDGDNDEDNDDDDDNGDEAAIFLLKQSKISSAIVTIKSDYKNETRHELLCCKYRNGNCCAEIENKCCPADYQCCPPNNCCSNSDTCIDGKCSNSSGKPSERVPAELIFPKIV